MGAIQCSREYKKFLKSISIHFNCSFMQLKQQTSSDVNGEIIGLDENQIVVMCFWILNQSVHRINECNIFTHLKVR